MHSKKSYFKTFLLSSVMLTSATVSVQAHASWWDKGAELFKEVQEKAPEVIKSKDSSTSSLSSSEIQKAFKEALSLGSEAVVKQLSTKDGFNADQAIHIPLPGTLKSAQSMLNRVGMGDLMDDLELKLNRAAEAATPEAKALFINAVKEMTFEDVQKIYQGPKDSATQYLRSKTGKDLAAKMRPIIENTLNSVGAVKAYDKAISEYKNIPFVPDVKADLLQHVTDKGMDGMFYYLAKEEASIRKDPVKQSTELLKKVFGSN